MRTMTEIELLSGLRRVSPSFTFYEAQDSVWCPSQDYERPARGLYVERSDGYQFICGVTRGPVHEYDIVREDGKVLVRGWKETLRKVVLAGFASKWALEEAFKTSLGNPRDPFPRYRRCGCLYIRHQRCRHGEGIVPALVQLKEELKTLPEVESDSFYQDENASRPSGGGVDAGLAA